MSRVGGQNRNGSLRGRSDHARARCAAKYRASLGAPDGHAKLLQESRPNGLSGNDQGLTANLSPLTAPAWQWKLR